MNSKTFKNVSLYHEMDLRHFESDSIFNIKPNFFFRESLWHSVRGFYPFNIDVSIQNIGISINTQRYLYFKVITDISI